MWSWWYPILQVDSQLINSSISAKNEKVYRTDIRRYRRTDPLIEMRSCKDASKNRVLNQSGMWNRFAAYSYLDTLFFFISTQFFCLRLSVLKKEPFLGSSVLNSVLSVGTVDKSNFFIISKKFKRLFIFFMNILNNLSIHILIKY